MSRVVQILLQLLVVSLLFGAIAPQVVAQVSPAEIPNPDLKALEQSYLPQLKALHDSVGKLKFPFPFYLSRYLELDPAQQAGADTRGLEFVRFQNRVLLKVTGNYEAAYDTTRLTQNERAADTFQTVVLPILNLLVALIPTDVACDGIGFEIGHHTRTRTQSYEFEGKETLVVVLDRPDAWVLARASTDAERQEILNRSEVFVSGAEFGLSLTERDPLNVEGLPRSVPARLDATSTARSAVSSSHSPLMKPAISRESSAPALPALVDHTPVTNDSAAPHGNSAQSSSNYISGPNSHEADSASAAKSAEPLSASNSADPPTPNPVPTQKDADRLGEKYQRELAELAKLGAAKFHFVDYAPPAFLVFRNQLALQITLRNALQFDPAKGSIYKRAAQSFDLFLAPLLKDISEKVPADADFQVFDFSVLNKLAPGPKGTSEAVEYICPRAALRQFTDADITNQQLLDHSVILVNGFRIALNLQLVE